ncbi:MAG: hypothetical protein JWM03_1921, partial [Rhodocyclales bacterium]|nr:hypothetical protein [Rhodocyclales bacterium]
GMSGLILVQLTSPSRRMRTALFVDGGTATTCDWGAGGAGATAVAEGAAGVATASGAGVGAGVEIGGLGGGLSASLRTTGALAGAGAGGDGGGFLTMGGGGRIATRMTLSCLGDAGGLQSMRLRPTTRPISMIAASNSARGQEKEYVPAPASRSAHRAPRLSAVFMVRQCPAVRRYQPHRCRQAGRHPSPS